MWKLLLRQSSLLLFLAASVAVAKDREPRVRNVYIRDELDAEVAQVYVTKQVATVLRLPRPCDPERTTMLGWEGRFEPVECVGRSVLIVPIQKLEPEDRILLRVTLADGKELPFTVTAISEKEWERPDQQVNVFLELETPEALRAQLEDTRTRERLLEEANRRHWEEDTEDHALARLLRKGSVNLTPLKARRRWILKKEGRTVEATFLTGQAKAAVLFHVTNLDPSNRPRVVRRGETVCPPERLGRACPRRFRLSCRRRGQERLQFTRGSL
jgi:hypothetical protein